MLSSDRPTAYVYGVSIKDADTQESKINLAYMYHHHHHHHHHNHLLWCHTQPVLSSALQQYSVYQGGLEPHQPPLSTDKKAGGAKVPEMLENGLQH